MQTQKIDKDMKVILNAYNTETKIQDITNSLKNVNKFLYCKYLTYNSQTIKDKINNKSNIDILNNIMLDCGLKTYLIQMQGLYKNVSDDKKLYFSIRYSKDTNNNIDLIRYKLNEYATIDYSIINNEYIIISKIDIMQHKEHNKKDAIEIITNLLLEYLYYFTYFLINLHKDINFNFSFMDFIILDDDNIKRKINNSFIESENINNTLIELLKENNIIDFAIYYKNERLYINNYDENIENKIIENYNNFTLYLSNFCYNVDTLYYILDTYNKIIN